MIKLAFNKIFFRIIELEGMTNYKIIGLLFWMFTGSVVSFSQPPNWVYSGNFPATMTAIFSVSDECVPSADVNDIVGAFDINGEVRGVGINIGTQAYITIGGNFFGEKIYLKVYDAGSDQVYWIHDFTIDFESGSNLDPDILNFDSNSTNTSGGPDQNVFDAISTSLQASGSGTWQIMEGAGGSLADASNPTTTLTGVIDRIYQLAWTFSATQGCIGETDLVNIRFITSVPENTMARCQDGLDNNNDGLTDCDDPSCGRPVVQNISKMDPTPLSCTTDQGNGTIEVTETGTTLFSLDNGLTTQMSNIFTSISAGTHNVWMQNDFVGCIARDSITLENYFDPDPPTADTKIIGPELFCWNLNGVTYSLDRKVSASVSWSFSDNEVSLTSSGQDGLADFGSNSNDGTLTATMTGLCITVPVTLEVNYAGLLNCILYGGCSNFRNIDNSVLDDTNAPHIYRAGIELTSDAQLPLNNYDFSAGSELLFEPGFSVDLGTQFVASIRNCGGN